MGINLFTYCKTTTEMKIAHLPKILLLNLTACYRSTVYIIAVHQCPQFGLPV